MIRMSALQMQTAGTDTAANLKGIEKAAHQAAEAGASLLVTPELGVTSYGGGRDILNLAEPANGPIVDRLGEIARQTGIAIIAGFAEKAGMVVYNSAVYTDGANTPSIYRKSHLYGDYERALFSPETPTTCLFSHRGMTLGMLICYDVEFPENVRRLALAGADMILVPTATPKGASGTFIAEKMIPVRAFENQIFIAYVNNIGRDGAFDYAGRSVIAAPDGSALASAGLSEELLTVDIAPALYARSRGENTYLKDLFPA
ncbi:MAG: carbon-nitrogen hydrolase family protein [Hoeflea sp.]|uniref:carbon-nitrogen hydrolase family protein n=1 Tax=Hoeflea sp. TaxID=1940281 RepID=UPI001DCEFF03|nr:carbon-nitrogen hydrolase family protein [Hoeflea sp.]MBU4531970.1 carbon-nitrogen hydrolase family protein [Alphaproteobacteria bacterium]MBU4546392.1 carbon-nitrogen hydrolase family protein [Alphaproteobacteria bacterium]MBU4549521.1 carbon-nitrogen hydrolase family protein [Alphaproteobacteria bacterium]MBV1722696.1 carbon-nitrogen hydrolase family protein [Hoeflea sp.]MBV1782635.1 carbon-nitrogen hydrolase family protein [Hoeflea sp.]